MRHVDCLGGVRVSPLDAMAWLVVGLCYLFTACVLLIVFAASALWARSRVHVRAWMRERPVETLWTYQGAVYRVRVDDERVTVRGLGDGAAASIMGLTEFATMARSGVWRRVSA